MFIQYYNKLMTSLKNYEPLPFLYNCLDSYDYYMIVKYIDKVISKDSSKEVSISGTEFSKDAIKTVMLLAIIAIKLYYYSTESFYKMLKFMQSYPGVQQLATEILSKVKEFDPLISSGMNINVICINMLISAVILWYWILILIPIYFNM